MNRKSLTMKDKNNGNVRVNLSEQSVTIFPKYWLKQRGIVSIDLSVNSLRRIPIDIKRLTRLTTLNLSRTRVYCNEPDDSSSLPLELALIPSLTSLNVAQCNLRYVPPVVWKCVGLEELDVSRNKLNVLPPDLGSLVRLRRLNAQDCSLATLPKEIANCQDLVEVLLWGNVIESLPESMKYLQSLHRLLINYRTFCSVVDSYMESLLQRGRIPSEHLPSVVFELPTLESLDLAGTKINCLPERCVSALQHLSLANNFFQTFPSVLFQLTGLVSLDVSDNQLRRIPSDIAELKSLKMLVLNHNELDAIPDAIGELESLEELYVARNQLTILPDTIGKLARLRTLVLERNRIRQLPETVANLSQLETLDLTANLLKNLPDDMYRMTRLTTAHTYRHLYKFGLWIHRNPLDSIPKEIWQTGIAANIFGYLRDAGIERRKCPPQRTRVLILGNSSVGKTSLLRALRTGATSPLAGGTTLVRPTDLVEFSLWRVTNELSAFVHDVSGDAVESCGPARAVCPWFLPTDGCLCLLVYDGSSVKADDKTRFKSSVAHWIDMLLTHCRRVVIKLVSTKLDLIQQYRDADDVGNVMTSEQIISAGESVRQGVLEQLRQYRLRLRSAAESLDTLTKKVAAAAKDVNDLTLLSATRNRAERKRVKRMNFDENEVIHVLEQVSFIGGPMANATIANLRSDIEQILAENDQWWPEASDSLPPQNQQNFGIRRQNKAAETFARLVKSRPGWFLDADALAEIATISGVSNDEIPSVLRRLSVAGHISWFPENCALQDVVFHRPTHLVEVFRALFGRAVPELLEKIGEQDKRVVLLAFDLAEGAIFHKAREQFQRFGRVSDALLRVLLLRQLHADKDEDVDECPTVQRRKCAVLKNFDLCYHIITENRTLTKTSDRCESPAKSDSDWVSQAKSEEVLAIPALNIAKYHEDNLDTLLVENSNTLISQHDFAWMTSDSSWTQDVNRESKRLRMTYSFPVLPALGLFERLACRVNEILVKRRDWCDVIIGRLADDDGTGAGLMILERGVDSDRLIGLRIALQCAVMDHLRKTVIKLQEIVDSLMCQYPGASYQCLIETGKL